MGAFSSSKRRGFVQDSAELQRIEAIPRRRWDPESAAHWARRWTEALGRPPRTDCDPDECPCGGAGFMSLRPIQAIALSEIAQWGGGFFPIRVGGGKTLISLLAPRVRPNVKRPLILVPAHLREKTEREKRLLRRHWVLPAFVRVESYQTLSRVSGARLLEEYEPDMIVADECHYLKNPGAACTKRTSRYTKEAGDRCACVFMSGTITKRSIRDFAHLASWALPHTNPCPENLDTLDEWSRALDVNVHESRRLAPGALDRLKATPFEDVRAAFRRRLMDSPGVVATQDPPLPIELQIRSHRIELDEDLRGAYRTLRDQWITPDDWPVEDGVAMWRHARELASGFFSRWDPRPPDDWRDARREWAAASREILRTNRRRLDTELQVRRAVEDGHYPHASRTLAEWLHIQPTFEPNAEAVWISDRTMKWIVEWARSQPDPVIIWTERPAVGHRLDSFGIPYFGNMGLRGGQFIEAAAGQTIAASIDANATGRNLQAWNRNLIVDVPPNGSKWEQLLGRTHRDGQRAEVVHVDVLFGCIEDVTGFWRAVEDSEFMEDMTGQAHKLVHADIEDVHDVITASTWPGPQWHKTT